MIAPPANKQQKGKRKESCHSRIKRVAVWLASPVFVVIIGVCVYWMGESKEMAIEAKGGEGRALIPDVGTRHKRGTDSIVDNSPSNLADGGGKDNASGNGGIDQATEKKVDPQMVGRLVKPPVRKKLFKHVSDAQIGRILAVNPGGLILGSLNYHRNHFVDNFKKSLEDPEPVVFSDDDTPEERELKEAVIEARAELKAALERGEDIAAIMQEAEDELHEMQQYRMAMREQMLQCQKEDGLSVKDLEDLNAAVNKMLSERGLKPLRSAKLQAIKMKLNGRSDL